MIPAIPSTDAVDASGPDQPSGDVAGRLPHGACFRSASGAAAECGAVGRGAMGRGTAQFDVRWARAGDHPAVERFLSTVFAGPSRDEFQAALDDPFYEPTDRLLVRRGDRIAAHVQIVKRTMHFGRQRLPVARLAHLGTLPEFRLRGYASGLLAAAQTQMLEDGAVFALVTTDAAEFFARRGWTACGRALGTRASARDVLPRLPVAPEVGDGRRGAAGSRHASGLNIRHWLQFELDSLERIYRHNTGDSLGPLDRSEAYWHWLISRRAFDRIYVAIDGPDRLELGQAASPIVGYAVTRRGRIVELLTAPTHPTDAVVLQTAAHDPLHSWMVAAGGTWQPSDARRCVHMARLLDVERFLHAVGPELFRRAKQAKLRRPCELGLIVDEQRQRLCFSRRSARWMPGLGTARSWVRLDREALTRLAFGQADVSELAAQGRIATSHATAAGTLEALFPRRPLWWPSFDELAA
jgi:predicted acetyltransferase